MLWFYFGVQASSSAQIIEAQAIREPEPPVAPSSSFKWTTKDRPCQKLYKCSNYSLQFDKKMRNNLFSLKWKNEISQKCLRQKCHFLTINFVRILILSYYRSKAVESYQGVDVIHIANSFIIASNIALENIFVKVKY